MRYNRAYMRSSRIAGATWGIVGITLLIGSAVGRLLPRMFDALGMQLTTTEWVVLVTWVLFMLVGEGYRGFQKQFSPRVAARMWHLANHGRTIDLWLAPLYCVGYYHATRRRKVSSRSLSAGIVVLILIVVHFSQPWRGIVDTGVVLGLLYGLVWIYIFTWQTIRSRSYIADPEIVPGLEGEKGVVNFLRK